MRVKGLVVIALLTGCSVNAGGTGEDLDLTDSSAIGDDTAVILDSSVAEDTAPPDAAVAVDSMAPVDSATADTGTVTDTRTDGGTVVVDSGADTFETAPPVDAMCPTCPPLATCVAGACTCPTNAEICVGKCLDLKADPNRCGNCDLGLPCAQGSMCANGTCACQPGLTLCSGLCVDTKGHVNHCGGCGKACAANERCRDGMCVAASSTSCPSARPDECTIDPNKKSCFNTKRDPMHCGGCGSDKRCDSDEVCVDGSCGNYAVGVGCSTCPCPNCATILSGSRCCPAPPGGTPGRVFCVVADACPLWLPP